MNHISFNTEVVPPDYSEEFDRLRRNRVAVSYHKYGPASKNFGEGRVDALATAELCLEAFKRDHNCLENRSGPRTTTEAWAQLGHPSIWRNEAMKC